MSTTDQLALLGGPRAVTAEEFATALGEVLGVEPENQRAPAPAAGRLG